MSAQSTAALDACARALEYTLPLYSSPVFATRRRQAAIRVDGCPPPRELLSVQTMPPPSLLARVPFSSGPTWRAWGKWPTLFGASGGHSRRGRRAQGLRQAQVRGQMSCTRIAPVDEYCTPLTRTSLPVKLPERSSSKTGAVRLSVKCSLASAALSRVTTSRAAGAKNRLMHRRRFIPLHLYFRLRCAHLTRPNSSSLGADFAFHGPAGFVGGPEARGSNTRAQVTSSRRSCSSSGRPSRLRSLVDQPLHLGEVLALDVTAEHDPHVAGTNKPLHLEHLGAARCANAAPPKKVENTAISRRARCDSAQNREISQAARGTLVTHEALKRCLRVPSARIFDSSVEPGIPSLAAAPVGPDTRPLHSARSRFDHLPLARSELVGERPRPFRRRLACEPARRAGRFELAGKPTLSRSYTGRPRQNPEWQPTD